MSSRYALWMRVDLLNQYFSDGMSQGIELRPSRETEGQLANARMRPKQVGNSLLIITETDGAGKPKTAPKADTRFTFYIDLVDPSVTTVSNMDLDALRGARFHFTNLAANPVGASPNQALHLSLPLANYDAAKIYLPGALVSKSGKAFECLKVSTANDPEAPNTTFWIDKGVAAFVSNRDLVPIRPALSRFKLQSAASVFDVKVYGLDTSTHTYTKLVHQTFKSQPPGETADEVLVDLSHLPPTRYHVEINGELFEAFFDDEAKARSALGVVELFHHLNPADAYSPADASGALRQVEYTLSFANRRAYWRYETPLHKVSDILITGAHADPSPFTADAAKNYYRSNSPLGMSEAPGENLFDLIVDGDPRPAPRPDRYLAGVLTYTYDEPSKTWREPVFNIRLNL